MKKLGLVISFLFFLNDGFAKSPIVAPQPTSCITGSFSSTGTNSWQTVSLKLTNNCEQTVDFQNSTVTFSNGSNLNTSFWGNFSPLSYPVNNLQITSQPQSGTYLSTLSLEFPTYLAQTANCPREVHLLLFMGNPRQIISPIASRFI